jgi:hypothetical protein
MMAGFRMIVKPLLAQVLSQRVCFPEGPLCDFLKGASGTTCLHEFRRCRRPTAPTRIARLAATITPTLEAMRTLTPAPFREQIAFHQSSLAPHRNRIRRSEVDPICATAGAAS